MNSLQVFNSVEFGEVRTLEIENEPWFVGKDVAESLGYSNTRKALIDHIDSEDKGVTKCDTLKGKQDMTIINESGLYSLILSSKLPNAKKFKRWVTNEVLPQIRKTGVYQVQQNTISVLNETVADLQGTIVEYKKLCKITCSRKQQYIRYIKNRLGIDKANKEFEQVKARLFLVLGVEKWEDIDFETANNLIQIIDESIRVIKAERPYKQLSYFEC